MSTNSTTPQLPGGFLGSANDTAAMSRGGLTSLARERLQVLIAEEKTTIVERKEWIRRTISNRDEVISELDSIAKTSKAEGNTELQTSAIGMRDTLSSGMELDGLLGAFEIPEVGTKPDEVSNSQGLYPSSYKSIQDKMDKALDVFKAQRAGEDDNEGYERALSFHAAMSAELESIQAAAVSRDAAVLSKGEQVEQTERIVRVLAPLWAPRPTERSDDEEFWLPA